jgi:hypothetical protein
MIAPAAGLGKALPKLSSAFYRGANGGEESSSQC